LNRNSFVTIAQEHVSAALLIGNEDFVYTDFSMAREASPVNIPAK
jgi:hypothetical protein